MSFMSLLWVGDLHLEKRISAIYTKLSDDRYHPKLIELKEGQNKIKIGRINSTSPPNYLIESFLNKRMISRTHATVERLPKGGFMLYDHSTNGTYVNYIRVPGSVLLHHGDVVCFGHLNGANLKPGDGVTPFFSDLKYQVCIGSSEEVAAVTNETNPDPISVSKIQRKTPEIDHEVKRNAVTTSKNPNCHQSGDKLVSDVKFEPKDSDEGVTDPLSKVKSLSPSREDSIKRTSSCKFNGVEKCFSPPPTIKKNIYHSKKSHDKEVPCDADNNDRYADGVLEGDRVEVVQEECSANACRKPAGTPID